jgi:hypothetical protein
LQFLFKQFLKIYNQNVVLQVYIFHYFYVD